MSAPAGNPLDLSGRLVLITGGAGATGRVIVEHLHRAGATMLVNDVVAQAPTGERLEYRPADVSDPTAVGALFDAIEADHGRMPDSVCAHAGLVVAHPVESYPLDTFDQLLRVNLRAAFIVAREAAARWRAAGTPGELVFTTSWVQDVPWPEIAPYSATKAALRSLTRSFARELAPYGIRANAIAPGIVGVGMGKRQWDEEPEYRRRAEKAIPLGYLQPPESVADAFLFLLSPMASYMTGSVLLVDGGASLYPMD